MGTEHTHLQEQFLQAQVSNTITKQSPKLTLLSNPRNKGRTKHFRIGGTPPAANQSLPNHECLSHLSEEGGRIGESVLERKVGI
uniref:Uncharacterized protein n=1 Tax=Setaria italica TaxID=4555 RepID=K3YFD9_SETIT